MRKWLRNIRGEHFAFTGKAWLQRQELEDIIRSRGGIPTRGGGKVTSETTVLVRGDSSVWKYGKYGTKEQKASELVRNGAKISVVHDSEFRKLLEHKTPARIVDRIAGEPVEWLTAPRKQQFVRAASIRGPLDREHSALGRVEQSYLRGRLFDGKDQATCSLCGRNLPVGLLIAAHVKPRSECSRSERLDVPNIVFSVCLLGCDALYEQGLLGVSKGGRILVSTTQSCRAIKAVFRGFRGRVCPEWNSERMKYFNWHLRHQFQGSKDIS
jgi:hypothetical protein